MSKPPRILILGGGSRGHTYASFITSNAITVPATVVAIADPNPIARRTLGARYIWGPRGRGPRYDEEFTGWEEWVVYERERRTELVGRGLAGESGKGGGEEEQGGALGGVDAVVVAVLDEMHVEVCEALAELGGVHVLCEKPLATSLGDCLRIYRGLGGRGGKEGLEVVGEDEGGMALGRQTLFGICHVLRYSPHNLMLRELVLERGVVGDVVSVEHTEPVGWWHFSHSYVRGNWRKESKTAPSLLTKSCHDIDWILWMLCSQPKGSTRPPHLPSQVSSTGSVKFFKNSRKPQEAGDATNCLSCPIENSCMYSAKKIYLERFFENGIAGWPVKILNPEIEELYTANNIPAAKEKLMKRIAEDYTKGTPIEEIENRQWYGRCVWESDNDVCDDQSVTITWEDDPLPEGNNYLERVKGRGAKTAQFHMVAFTEKQCDRRGRIYGTKGEIEYDSFTIKVHDFTSGTTKEYYPKQEGGGHGGGDAGIAMQFVKAIDAVKNGGMSVEKAQKEYIGCTLEEIFRSHAMVFAVEHARTRNQVINWSEWWEKEVDAAL